MQTVLRPLLIKLWQLYLRKRLDKFTEEVLGFTNGEHHREWYSILADKLYRKIVIAAPRGHTKSTSFTVNYPLWRMEQDHNIRIVIVTNAEAQGQSFLREIVGHIERNQMYVDFAGQLRPEGKKKWSGREIIIKRDNMNIKDPTISTVGVGGTILSKRADEIICDDLLNPENTRTAEQRMKMAEWFHQVLLPILVPGGRVIVVGTVWHPNDLLHALLDDAGWDFRKRYKAVIDEPVHPEMWDTWYGIRMQGTRESRDEADKYFTGNYAKMHEGVKVMWSQVWTYAQLYLLKRTNSVAFEKAYQNNIVSREDQKFKEEWLEAAKQRGANYRLVKTLSTDARRELSAVGGGIDLAAGEGEMSDDNAMASLGERRMDQMLVLLSLDGGKFSPALWRKTIAERYRGILHDRILVESNGYQVALKRDLADENLPVAAYATGGEKLDPYIGVESMAIVFENNRIILPYDKSDPYTIAEVDKLVDELRQFPLGHTGDRAMALWFSFTALRDLVSGTAKHGFLQMVQEDLQRAKEGGKPSTNLPTWLQAVNRQQQQ